MTEDKAKAFFAEVAPGVADNMTIVCSHKGVSLTFDQLNVGPEAGETISLHTVNARQFC